MATVTVPTVECSLVAAPIVRPTRFPDRPPAPSRSPEHGPEESRIAAGRVGLAGRVDPGTPAAVATRGDRSNVRPQLAPGCPEPLPAGPGYRMGRWARLGMTLTVTLAVVVAAATLLGRSGSPASDLVTVEPGDTLWSVAGARRLPIAIRTRWSPR